MTLLYSSPRFLDHETLTHPERPQRLIQVVRHLERTGLAARCQVAPWQAATEQELARVHDAGYPAMLAEACRQGHARIEEDTVVSRESESVARFAAGAVCDAVRQVVKGSQRQALCLVRPPGHHALADRPMGFCLYSNVALGVRVATDELALDRVLVVDWDVHHGNGTQDAFWTDPRVGVLSIHRWPFYPGTGRADETGTGDALGTTRNLPIAMGTSRQAYLDLFRSELEDFARRIAPQLVLISAGFDAHRDDPVGSLGLEIEDFAELTAAVLDVAAATCESRVVSVLEGGYNPGILAGCVEAHLNALLERDPAPPVT